MFIPAVLFLAQLLAKSTLAVPHERAVAFFSPSANGGSMLDDGVYKFPF
jgi:hypothetical protein